MVAPSDFQSFSWGPCGHPRSLQGGEKVPYWLLRARARPQNRSTAFSQWIMAPWALPHCKYAVNLAVARGIVNMQSIGLAAIYGAPSGNLGSENNSFKQASQLKDFFQRIFAVIEMATGHCKYEVNRAGDPLRGTLSFSRLFRDRPSETRLFFAFIEVGTGLCKNEVNRAGGHFGAPHLIFITFSRWARDTVKMQ